MMMFQWGYWQTFLNESAFHLKNRMGEHLVRQLYGKHKLLFGLDREPVKCLLDRILARLRKDMTLGEFLDMMRVPRSGVGRGWRIFQKWARRPASARDVEVLQTFLSVLVYEVNRPNLHWYGHHDPLLLSESQKELLYDLGPGRADPSQQIKWRAEVEEYLARARLVTKGGWWSWVQKTYYWASRPVRMVSRLLA